MQVLRLGSRFARGLSILLALGHKAREGSPCEFLFLGSGIAGIVCGKRRRRERETNDESSRDLFHGFLQLGLWLRVGSNDPLRLMIKEVTSILESPVDLLGANSTLAKQTVSSGCGINSG